MSSQVGYRPASAGVLYRRLAMKVTVFVATFGALLPTLTACGGSPGPSYYVAAGGSGPSRAVVLIQWSPLEGG